MLTDPYLKRYLRINRAMDSVMWFITGFKHPSMYESDKYYHEYTEGLTSGFVWKINFKIRHSN